MDKHFFYALSFISADSRGLVSEATKVLFENGFNIADSSSTLLHGVFSMIFIVTSGIDMSENAVKDMFGKTRFIPNVYKFSPEKKETEGMRYSISVYGADKPGIVHEIASSLAENGVNIADLQTKVTERGKLKVYIMVLEAIVPENVKESSWTAALSETAGRIGTNVAFKKIETYEF